MRIPFLAGLIGLLTATAAQAAHLDVADGGFVLSVSASETLRSPDLVGAELEIADGEGGMMQVRIDAVAPAPERSAVLLHTLSVRDAATGDWRPLCSPDAQGRRAAFPLRGRWEGRRFVADPEAWFLACTSGSNGKCVLWGYDPWARGPGGEDLADFYRACQQMTRADYAGRGEPHTRNGTRIDVADVAGVQTHEAGSDYVFEAGWGPDGAVCVARTRWPDLVTREAVLAQAPGLAGPCDAAAAKARGALLFTRIQPR